MNSAVRLPAQNSYAALAPDSPLSRPLRAPRRKRSPEFAAAFDAKTLFYDCFWHADGVRVLLVGPPPGTMRPFHELAQFIAHPSGTVLKGRLHPSLSVMLTELRNVPQGTTRIGIDFAGQHFELLVQPNSSAELAGRRVLFSVNKNNDLKWVREWAHFHATVHGADAVILFDNGSTAYGTDELAATLQSVPGVTHVAVPHWPYSFGPIDRALRIDPFWSRFFQISTMSVVLRRYGAAAAGLLNCDVDELAGTRSGRSIFALAEESRSGLVTFRGQWIEAVADGTVGDHRDFTQRLADPKRAQSRPRKWALDPRRKWVESLAVHPYWHWLTARPLFGRHSPADALYWHFRGINTDWKQQRNRPPATGSALEHDPMLTLHFALQHSR